MNRARIVSRKKLTERIVQVQTGFEAAFQKVWAAFDGAYLVYQVSIAAVNTKWEILGALGDLQNLKWENILNLKKHKVVPEFAEPLERPSVVLSHETESQWDVKKWEDFVKEFRSAQDVGYYESRDTRFVVRGQPGHFVAENSVTTLRHEVRDIMSVTMKNCPLETLSLLCVMR
jgi:hypothetical protein